MRCLLIGIWKKFYISDFIYMGGMTSRDFSSYVQGTTMTLILWVTCSFSRFLLFVFYNKNKCFFSQFFSLCLNSSPAKYKDVCRFSFSHENLARSLKWLTRWLAKRWPRSVYVIISYSGLWNKIVKIEAIPHLYVK